MDRIQKFALAWGAAALSVYAIAVLGDVGMKAQARNASNNSDASIY